MTNGGVGEEPAKRTEEETCTQEFFFGKLSGSLGVYRVAKAKGNLSSKGIIKG